MTFLGDGNKSSPLNTNWTSPKQLTNDKRKPLDDSYAGVSWPFLHFKIYYRSSDECPAEWLEEESARKMKINADFNQFSAAFLMNMKQ